MQHSSYGPQNKGIIAFEEAWQIQPFPLKLYRGSALASIYL